MNGATPWPPELIPFKDLRVGRFYGERKFKELSINNQLILARHYSTTREIGLLSDFAWASEHQILKTYCHKYLDAWALARGGCCPLCQGSGVHPDGHPFGDPPDPCDGCGGYGQWHIEPDGDEEAYPWTPEAGEDHQNFHGPEDVDPFLDEILARRNTR